MKLKVSGGSKVESFAEPILPDVVAQHYSKVLDRAGEDRPFFVMDADQVVRQGIKWERLLPRVEPFYAVKCNSDPFLLRMLAERGYGFDCASKGEIELVLGMGVRPERIIYANPCKTRSYIRHAQAVGVRLMTFDNAEELRKVVSVFPEAQLVLRIAVSDPTALCQLNTKFGCEPTVGAEILLQVAAAEGVNVAGISFHVGSGCRDPTAYGIGIARARHLTDFGRALGHCMEIVDIGGGYPGSPNSIISFEMIANEVNKAIELHFPPEDTSVRLIAEPGRYFASAAYSLVCNIIAKTKVPAARITGDNQEGEGIMYYINDGVYGSFNCILYDHFTPTAIPLMETGEEKASAIWGPTCDGLDQIIPNALIPEMNEGDWILFHHMGAYTLAAGSEFNGFPRPTVFYCGTAAALGTIMAEMDDGYDSAASSRGFSSEDTDQEQA